MKMVKYGWVMAAAMLTAGMGQAQSGAVAASTGAATVAPQASSQATQGSSQATQPPPILTAQLVAGLQKTLADWANLKRYTAENATVKQPASDERRVVFMGDSITDAWGHPAADGTPSAIFFPGKPYYNRGISGQTTPQMVVRFQQDVVHLRPAAVVILAGTNDVAGNTGPETVQMIEDNFMSMNAIAHQYGIKVIMASITPAYSYPWKPGVEPVAEIRQLNQWLRTYCAVKDCIYLDYYSAMDDGRGAMKPGLAKDGVHPTVAGYAVMAPLAEAAIAKALGPR